MRTNMKTLRNTIATVALATLVLSSYAFAQNSASASANVKISLKKGLAIENIGGSEINFTDVVVTSSAQAPTVAAGGGAHFLVTGHPNKPVSMTFSTVTLNNTSWVSSYGGGTESTMIFTPVMQHTGSESTYASGTPVSITSGNAANLVNVNGVGNLNLWVGGSMAIAADQPQGDYIGSFSVTVAY